MIKRAWRWLFHRHDQPTNREQPCGLFSPGISVHLDTNRRWRVACEQDDAIPEECPPDIKPKRTDTAHITRIIETKTKPLPALNDDEPTQDVPGWQFYAEDTMRVQIDEYATAPMELAELRR